MSYLDKSEKSKWERYEIKMGKFKETDIDQKAEDEAIGKYFKDASPDRTDFPTEGDFLSMQLSHAIHYTEEIAMRIDAMIEELRYKDGPEFWERKEKLETLRAAVTDLERILE